MKFMKLGMLSWSGVNMPWYKFFPLGQVWVYASHKPKLLTTSMMVSVGNMPPLGMERYLLPLIAFKNFLVST